MLRQCSNNLTLNEFHTQTRVSHFALKLMDIDSEHLGIPETDYQCVVRVISRLHKICITKPDSENMTQSILLTQS
jgi:hypothetical protein